MEQPNFELIYDPHDQDLQKFLNKFTEKFEQECSEFTLTQKTSTIDHTFQLTFK